jgi:hypothetical protein
MRVFNLNQLTGIPSVSVYQWTFAFSMKINKLNVLVGFYYTFNWGVFDAFVKLRAYIDKVTSRRWLACDCGLSDLHTLRCLSIRLQPRRGGQNSTVQLNPLFSLRHSSMPVSYRPCPCIVPLLNIDYAVNLKDTTCMSLALTPH